MKRLAFVSVLVAGGVGLASLAGSNSSFSQTAPEGGGQRQATPAVPVTAAPVVQKSMPVEISTIGTVQTIASVQIRSRIDGVITKSVVQDGQEVKAGDVLFVLDSRQAEASLRQAEANLAKDRAQLLDNKRDVDRLIPLTEREFASKQNLDKTRTQAAVQSSIVQADTASAENFRVQLSYTTITAPITGRVGLVAVKAGNNVKANDVPLVTINQMRPIYVSIAVPQRNFAALRKAFADHTAKLEAHIQGEKDPEVGPIAFIDNQIDTASGTIAAKGVFDNADNRLWPGQFVNTVLTTSVQPDALVVPAPAIQLGQNGSYVFIVKPDSTVETRPVTVDRTVGAETVVTSGLKQGETVVVDGQLRLTQGTRVEIRRPSAGPAAHTDAKGGAPS